MTPDEIQDDVETENEDGAETRPFLMPFDMAENRLDKVLAALLTDLSRTRLKNLILSGAVWVEGAQVLDPSVIVRPGLEGVVLIPYPEPACPMPENIPLDIIYEDNDVLVLSKHADMVVHPAVGHSSGTLVNALLFHCGDSLSGIGGIKRPGIVHRLDRGTSGLMIVAKNDTAHQALSAQLADRTLGRIYHAVTFGVPIPPIGTIDRPVGRHLRDRLKMTIGGAGARSAVTHYHVQTRYKNVAALVECRLQTGRTHQIRVHLSAAGYPLWGDPLYGPQETAIEGALRRADVPAEQQEKLTNFYRQALHAAELHFVHPRTGEAMSFTAPYPHDMQELIKTFSEI